MRRRIAALVAMALFLGGFLLAIGFGALVLTLFALAAIGAGVVAFVAIWPEVRLRLREWNSLVGSRGRSTAAALGPLWQRARSVGRQRLGEWNKVLCSRGRRTAAELLPLVQRARSHAESGARRAYRSSATFAATVGRQGSVLAHTGVESGSRTGRKLAEAARSTNIRIAPRPPRTDPRGTALRLNAAGTQQRRDGRYDEAVECHRQALEILRALEDRQGVALTQSNLALALSHADDDDWAIGLFEEAAATLRELGDHEHEAQVMANLGLMHRRHGRREEGDNVLQLALTNLSPASSAYQTIEAELRRAS
jgi:tetratricopeptide (TPR) repeat protein